MTPWKNLPQIHLNPGEMHLSPTPSVVTTVLGSCVSVTLFHPKSRIGAICHGMLPHCQCVAPECLHGGCRECFRFVDCAILAMLDQWRDLGIRPAALETKLFGGADMFRVGEGTVTVGRQNVAMAREILLKTGLKLLSSDTGGDRGRKLLFFTHTGEVFLKRLSRTIPLTTIDPPL
ncbi:MAG: chemotaxis protein CheD [Magnetococcales bacterium]|nr:chemotaxis protein CheD [Magnetococcales bacterium]